MAGTMTVYSSITNHNASEGEPPLTRIKSGGRYYNLCGIRQIGDGGLAWDYGLDPFGIYSTRYAVREIPIFTPTTVLSNLTPEEQFVLQQYFTWDVTETVTTI